MRKFQNNNNFYKHLLKKLDEIVLRVGFLILSLWYVNKFIFIKNAVPAFLTGRITVSASKTIDLPITKVWNAQKVRWNNEPPTTANTGEDSRWTMFWLWVDIDTRHRQYPCDEYTEKNWTSISEAILSIPIEGGRMSNGHRMVDFALTPPSVLRFTEHSDPSTMSTAEQIKFLSDAH